MKKDKKQSDEHFDAPGKSELLGFSGIPRLERHANPYARWMGHRESFPLLKELASRVLPASSASPERLCSKAGLTLTKKHRKLRSTRVAQLVTVRSAVASECGLLDEY